MQHTRQISGSVNAAPGGPTPPTESPGGTPQSTSQRTLNYPPPLNSGPNGAGGPGMPPLPGTALASQASPSMGYRPSLESQGTPSMGYRPSLDTQASPSMGYRPSLDRSTSLSQMSPAQRQEEEKARQEFKDYESYLRYYSNQRVDTEINLQLGDLTLKTARLEVLDPAIANMPDFIAVFGPQHNRTPMQSAEVKNTLNRSWVRLVGRRHDIQYWVPDTRSPPLTLERPYRATLSGDERWIVDSFEGIRSRHIADIPLFMPNATYPHSATVAILSGVDPKTKTLKEIVVFRKPKVVHVYNIIEYGRRWYRSLCYSSDAKFCFPQSDTRVLTDRGFLFYDEIKALVDAGERVLYACYETSSAAVAKDEDAMVGKLLYSEGKLVLGKPSATLLTFSSRHEGQRWSAASGDYGTGPSAGQATFDEDDLQEELEEVDGQRVYSRHVSIRVTPYHRMFAQQGLWNEKAQLTNWSMHRKKAKVTKEDRTKGQPNGVVHPPDLVDADTLFQAGQCGPDCTGKATEKCAEHKRRGKPCPPHCRVPTERTCNHRRSRLRLLACCKDGHQPTGERVQWLDKEVRTKLGLFADAKFNAFLELLGFWIGNGHMEYYAASHWHDAVCFAQIKRTNVRFLEEMLQVLGVKHIINTTPRRVTGRPGSLLTVVRIIDRAWFDFFDREFGAKYKHSDYHNLQATLRHPPAWPALPEEEEPPIHLPGQPTKSVKWFADWILMCLRPEQLRLVIRGLWRADGAWARQNQVIFTSGVAFRDQLMQALLHCGYSAYPRLAFEAGAIQGWLWHRPAEDRRIYTNKEMAQLSDEQRANYIPLQSQHDGWAVTWAAPDSNSAKGSCWPTLDNAAITEAAYEQRQDGLLWCVEVTHPEHVIIAQRAARDASGVVTKQSRPVLIGNCYSDMEPRLVLNQSSESGNQSSFGSVMQSSAYQPAVVPHFEAGIIGYGFNPRPSVVISRSLTAALGTQVYIPPRLLFGLLPSTLLDDYVFWQNENDSLTGYPSKERAELEINSKTPAVLKVQIAGGTAKVTRTRYEDKIPGENEGDMVLLNLMYAPEGSSLTAIGELLLRLENLSHILVWTKTRVMKSKDEASIDMIELPRLRLSFAARTVMQDGRAVNRLYSNDHVGLYISQHQSVQIDRLMKGITHALLLENDGGEMFIMVPAAALPSRPRLASQIFPTNLVFDRRNKDWLGHLDVRHYLYPVSLSRTFMSTPTLAAALYLLLLRWLDRQYEQVFKLSDSCVVGYTPHTPHTHIRIHH